MNIWDKQIMNQMKERLKVIRDGYSMLKKSDRPLGHPCIKAFGQIIEFHSGTPMQFIRASLAVGRLHALVVKTNKALEKLDAQMLKTTELCAEKEEV